MTHTSRATAAGLGALLILIALAPVIASAADAPSPGSECISIDDAVSRLACYDQALGRGSTANAARAELPGGAFGFTETQKRARQSAATTDAEPKSIEATVTALSLHTPGRIRIDLDNGQVWIQAEAGGDSRLSIGDRVIVRRAALGSFLLQHGRSLALRVSRVR